jgi:hypothetical protein
MERRLFAISTAALMALLATPLNAPSQETHASYTLQVRVNYTGSGTVDEQHKIYIVLWDSPDFTKGENMMPAAIQSTSMKHGTVTFDAIAKSPTYVSSVYDPTGQWDAQSAPPEGSSLGLYSKTPGTPEPIQLQQGKTTTIDLTFDDSVKMRSGKPGL